MLASPGLNFLSGGSVASSSATQTDALPPELLGDIGAGNVNFLISADLGGFGSQDDNAQVLVQFDNDAGPVAKAYFLGPITSTQRSDQTTFIHVSATGPVRVNATKVFVQVTMTRVFIGGSYNDGYADNIMLVLLPKHALFLPATFR
jgi:hypothetical protein